MPAVTADDVMAAFKARWDGSILDALCPGGLHQGRASEGRPPGAYAVLTVEEDAPEETSGNPYLQSFRVEVDARGRQGGARAAEVRRALHARYDDAEASLAVTNAAKVVFCHAAAGARGLEDEPREAEDVWATRAAWDVLVQGSRG